MYNKNQINISTFDYMDVVYFVEVFQFILLLFFLFFLKKKRGGGMGYLYSRYIHVIAR